MPELPYRCRRDAGLFQLTSKGLRNFNDSGRPPARIDRQPDFAKLISPLKVRCYPDFGALPSTRRWRLGRPSSARFSASRHSADCVRPSRGTSVIRRPHKGWLATCLRVALRRSYFP